ncbi:hypothetical protein [Amycolatopsis magusensis]|nr:hypothetical protein [Amycolatopsis magusensis]MDI5980110.1 hypothetical protein [Amycolatopsis magusensis]
MSRQPAAPPGASLRGRYGRGLWRCRRCRTRNTPDTTTCEGCPCRRPRH